MSEMIERCAVAIDRLRLLKGPPSDFDIRWAVGEILAELREPTEAMVEAMDELAGTINPTDTYQLAIDAALTAPEPGS